MINCRNANNDEAKTLTQLAIRSKAHWGYSDTFMRACQQELTITEAMLCAEDSVYVVAENNGTIIGFYALGDVQNSQIELTYLFVEPTHIGAGVGRTLMENAIANAAYFGGKQLYIQGDPHAEGFYRAMGAYHTGYLESLSIARRYLPTFIIDLLGRNMANGSSL